MSGWVPRRPAGSPASTGGQFAAQPTPDAAAELRFAQRDAEVDGFAMILDDDANVDPEVTDARVINPYRAAAAIAAAHPQLDAGELADAWIDDPAMWAPSDSTAEYTLDIHAVSLDVLRRLEAQG